MQKAASLLVAICQPGLSTTIIFHQLFIVLDFVSVNCSALFSALTTRYLPSPGHNTADTWVSWCYIFFSSSPWWYWEGDLIPVFHMGDWWSWILVFHDVIILICGQTHQNSKGAIHLYQYNQYWWKYFETPPAEFESTYKPHCNGLIIIYQTLISVLICMNVYIP